MQPVLVKALKVPPNENRIFIISSLKQLPSGFLTREEQRYAKEQNLKNKKNLLSFNRLKYQVFVYFPETEKEFSQRLELCRKAGNTAASELNSALAREVILDAGSFTEEALAFAEGMALGSYQFDKYKTNSENRKNTLEKIRILSDTITAKEIRHFNILISAVYQCRNLVNEPAVKLNAQQLADKFREMGREAGFKVEILNHAKIASLKMGGLLAVNQGSEDPPTFTIMEYKPSGAVNTEPYVLIGKGIVFDTGGINLKTTSGMSEMKCDMAGAAVAGSVIYAVAKAKLPVWIIALVPATDNRPCGNAQVPGDIITMYDGTTVEVLNTDAEGRLILADALAYAKKYNPRLVIDIATLTGAAHAAIGKYGIVAMKARCRQEFDDLVKSGERVYERLVEFPLWDDYKELIKSEIADMKNIGGPYAGAITAGKFLEHFTAYPYIHLDIAGPAFNDKKDSYRGTGGTGYGVRLLFDYFLNIAARR